MQEPLWANGPTMFNNAKEIADQKQIVVPGPMRANGQKCLTARDPYEWINHVWLCMDHGGRMDQRISAMQCPLWANGSVMFGCTNDGNAQNETVET